MIPIGCARISTENQLTGRLDDLGAAGCAEVFEEHASGGDRNRPALAKFSRASEPPAPWSQSRLTDWRACSLISWR